MRLKRSISIALLAGMAALVQEGVQAQTGADGHTAHHGTAPEAAGAPAQGEVRRISKEQRKITLRHGEIKGLEMPPMSMVFNVRDGALLDTVKVGDQVEFSVVKDPDGSLVVTAIKAKR